MKSLISICWCASLTWFSDAYDEVIFFIISPNPKKCNWRFIMLIHKLFTVCWYIAHLFSSGIWMAWIPVPWQPWLPRRPCLLPACSLSACERLSQQPPHKLGHCGNRGHSRVCVCERDTEMTCLERVWQIHVRCECPFLWERASVDLCSHEVSPKASKTTKVWVRPQLLCECLCVARFKRR